MIRPAHPKDCQDIKSLLIQLGYSSLTIEYVSQKIISYQQENYHLLVAEEENHVIAFIALHCFDIFHSSGKMGRVTAFCVHEAFRNQGIGKNLLDAAEKYFMKEGCTKLEVTSNNRRQGAHKFYLSQGWIEDSRRFVKYL